MHFCVGPHSMVWTHLKCIQLLNGELILANYSLNLKCPHRLMFCSLASSLSFEDCGDVRLGLTMKQSLGVRSSSYNSPSAPGSILIEDHPPHTPAVRGQCDFVITFLPQCNEIAMKPSQSESFLPSMFLPDNSVKTM